MCGIVGILQSGPLDAQWGEALGRMSAALAHRGPDDAGQWLDPSAGLGFGFRRLAILDLSPAGHQPMFSASGRHCMIFNGEVYNFAELRAELEDRGVAFRSGTDTEVVLELLERHGAEEALRRCNGMFALALWDRRERVLTLARDRVGIKPLYYGWAGDRLVFASELRGFTSCPGFDAELDPHALELLVQLGYIPAPLSIYRGVRKLEPGHLLRVPAPPRRDRIERHCFWDARRRADEGLAHPFEGGEVEAVDELERLLESAVGLRMVADVPLGAFLSGGVDSSTVVALMQKQSSRRVKTFAIGFEDERYDEAGHARRVAEHLGTDHTELYLGPDEALQVVPRLPTLYDEPFADSSQLPTYLVARLARQQVTVALSGDGGDELFWGYNRYREATGQWRWSRRVPGFARRFTGRALSGAGLSLVGAHSGPRADRKRYRDARKLGRLLAADGPEHFYAHFFAKWHGGTPLLAAGAQQAPPLPPALDSRDFRQIAKYTDVLSYLPDDILVKLDRATMAVGLEGRVPILDHRVVELSWRLPLRSTTWRGRRKWALRAVLDRHVPAELTERPKRGFSVPIEEWLRGPLRDWAEALLDERRLASEGLFEPGPVRTLWEEHVGGRANNKKLLWSILMFQAWWEEQRRPTATPESVVVA